MAGLGQVSARHAFFVSDSFFAQTRVGTCNSSCAHAWTYVATMVGCLERHVYYDRALLLRGLLICVCCYVYLVARRVAGGNMSRGVEGGLLLAWSRNNTRQYSTWQVQGGQDRAPTQKGERALWGSVRCLIQEMVDNVALQLVYVTTTCGCLLFRATSMAQSNSVRSLRAQLACVHARLHRFRPNAHVGIHIAYKESVVRLSVTRMHRATRAANCAGAWVCGAYLEHSQRTCLSPELRRRHNAA